MRTFLVILAVGGLMLTLVPSLLNWQGITGPEKVNGMMLAGTVMWFFSASFLFGKKENK